jgi:hypothetical protein
MSYVVEVRHIGSDDLTDFLVEMRNWLDHNGIKPDTLDHSMGGPGVTFRARFATETQATSFAGAFGGWRCTDPHGTALWVMSVDEP